jgi:tRNA threonylcarbamoyladenosine biosynthesis protein TsaE
LQLGIYDTVNSPTFSIVNEYITSKNEKVYHFDFYRLKDEQEAYDLGYEEYFFGDNYCFIEWPEKIPNLIVNNMVIIKMKLEEKKRIIEIII